LKKAILIQSPAKFYEVVPIFYKEWNELGFFDKFYIVTDFKGPYNVGANCQIIKLEKDLYFTSNMLYALPQVEEDIFFMCCEDHIKKDGNDVNKFYECFSVFINNEEMGFLRLTNTKNKVKLEEGCDSFICPIYRKYKYYISLQPSLWRKDYFKQSLVAEKDAKEFETLGSKRARHHPSMKSFSVKESVFFRTNFYTKGYYRHQFVDYAIKNNITLTSSRMVWYGGNPILVSEYKEIIGSK